MIALSSATDNNPAAAIRREYSDLMTIASRDELATRAIEIVRSSSISAANRAKFEAIVAASDLDGLRLYLTNFILAADGQRVIGTRFGEHMKNRREFAGR